MKLLSVHVEKSLLRMALIDHKGKKSQIQKMRSFDLPENLANNLFMEEPESLANFIIASIEKSMINHKRIAIHFGPRAVIHREYTHAPGKKSQLIAIADTEAESILPGDDFIVENVFYDGVKTNKDMAISSIFAIPDSFTLELVNTLKGSGIKVVGVYSTLNTYRNMAARFLQAGATKDSFPGDTIAFIDISCDEIRATIFNKGKLVHQRIDDHNMDEACKTISESLMMPVSRIRSMINSGEIEAINQGGEIEEALMTAFSRQNRSLNVTLSELGLSLDGIVITGDGANLPNMASIVEEVTGAKTLSALDLYDVFRNLVGLDDELADRKDLYNNLLLLAGANGRKLKSVNFILRGLKRKKSKRNTIVVSALLVVLTLAVMSLQPINLLISTKDRDSLAKLIESQEYQDMQRLLNEHRLLQNELDSIEVKMSGLPFGQSHVAEDLTVLQQTLFPEASLTSLVYDHEGSKYTGHMTFGDSGVFTRAKNNINRRDDFRMNYPLSLYRSGNQWFSDFEVRLLQERTGN